ncbi:hypothetical protein E2C01_102294 [Portunus trituberculatus]|uniref:Uncharacterized protein n=1 Tax=Portunus trituberculatus TaxID=210409 RepID=A0A5B7KGY5_PORTR|nr:hypothetical protein [Portunus trituberculatus]
MFTKLSTSPSVTPLLPLIHHHSASHNTRDATHVHPAVCPGWRLLTAEGTWGMSVLPSRQLLL